MRSAAVAFALGDILRHRLGMRLIETAAAQRTQRQLISLFQ